MIETQLGLLLRNQLYFLLVRFNLILLIPGFSCCCFATLLLFVVASFSALSSFFVEPVVELVGETRTSSSNDRWIWGWGVALSVIIVFNISMVQDGDG